MKKLQIATMARLRGVAAFLCMAWLVLANNAQADSEVRIVIDGGSSDLARPVAVVPFKWNGTGEKPFHIADIVSADLRNSGMFLPMPVQSMPEQPVNARHVTPQAWARLGVGNVVVGQINPTPKGYTVAVQLVDTLGASGQVGRVLLEKVYAFTQKDQRLGAHTISDAVFKTLTGMRGAFRTKIAYIVQKNSGDKPYQLRIADYDGHNQYTLYRSSEPLMSPAWSADGHSIAYVSFEGQHSQLVLQNLFTQQRQILLSGQGHNGAPAFSPDGKYLAFSSSRAGGLNIYVMNLQTKEIYALTHGEGNNTEPSWTADSQRLIFTSDRTGSPQVYEMNLDGSNVQPLTNEGLNYGGELLADNKTLVYVARDHIAEKNLGTGVVQFLTSTYLDENPSVSPNGLMIIYSATQGLGKVLQLVSADGHFKARLPNPDGQVKYPAWSPYLFN